MLTKIFYGKIMGCFVVKIQIVQKIAQMFLDSKVKRVAM